MSYYINAFLRTEITCIPRILDKYVGKYYNNKLMNGITWICFIWIALHLIFDECINVLLKKMHYKEYLRKRIKQSVWNVGFFGMSFLYCSATMYKNDVDLFSLRKIINVDWEVVPGQYLFGFIILVTFYIHSVIWEALKRGMSFQLSSHLCLSLFILGAYFTRKIELAFALIAIISFSQLGVELAKCLINLCKVDTRVYAFFCQFILFIALMFFTLTHLIVLPLSFIVPLSYHLINYPSSTSLWLLNFTLWAWISSELLINPLFKMIKHWLHHSPETKRTSCVGNLVECSLFLPRDDLTFDILLMRMEIKEREAKMMSLRKPKNRNMLMQTLKCMIAIKRKLRTKRLSESSDSDDSEPSESRVCENKMQDELQFDSETENSYTEQKVNQYAPGANP